MAPFLFASIISFIIYHCTTHIVIKRSRLGTLLKYGGIRLTVAGPNKDVIRKIIISVVVFIAITVLYILLAWNDFVPNIFKLRYSHSIVVGFLFGPLLAIWVGVILRNPPGSSPTPKQSLALAGLLVLVAFGALGREAASVINKYAQSISEVSALGVGVKFSLIGADFTTRRQSEADLVFAPASGQSALPPGAASSGLQTLSELDAFVVRDCRLILDATLNNEIDPKIVDFCSDEYFSGGSRFDGARTFAKNLIADHAVCLGRYYEYSADTFFVEDTLKKFVPIVREVASLHFKNKNFGYRAALVLYGFSADVTRYLHASSLMIDPEPSTAPGIPQDDIRARLESVGEACLPMIALACDIDIVKSSEKTATGGRLETARPSKPDSDARSALDKSRQELRARQWSDFIADADARKKFQECGDKLTSQYRAGMRRPWRGRKDPGDIPSVDRLKVSLDQFIERDYLLKASFDRPYVAIAYAGLAASIKNYEAAAQTLTDWLSRSEAGTSVAERARHDWLEIRARSVLLNILEDWIRTLGEAAPVPLREQHIENAEKMAKAYERRLAAQANIAKFFDMKGDVALKGQYFIPYGRSCNLANDDIGRSHFMYLSMKQIYAFNVIKHPQYDKIYASRARSTIEEVLRSDLSCVSRSYGNDFTAVFRADALDLYARIVMQDARIRSKKESNSCTEACLEEAYAAVKQARSLIYSAQNQDAKERQNAKLFSQKISPSPVSDTTASLDRTEKDLGSLMLALKPRGDD